MRQSFRFSEGEGYQPASSFSDGVAYLYLGYPEDEWVDGTTLSNRYVNRWIAGYQAVVEDARYTLQRTSERPAVLGMGNSEQDAGTVNSPEP